MTCICAIGEDQREPFPIIPDEYMQTERIVAGLSISNGEATCNGRLAPYGTHSCSLEMILYKKNGGGWDKIQTWSVSATGGNQASLTRTYSVGHGTYKVVCNGNVDGECSSVTSEVVSW